MNTKDKITKIACENSYEFYCRYMFKEYFGKKLKIYPHLQKIIKALEKVAKGETKRLIINVPPRYFKTEFAVKLFISWGIAVNAKSRFIHLSYSDDLALDNSQWAKDYVLHEAYQKLWTIELKKDTQSKKKWYTKEGGGVYATATGGQVTGFGAGNMIDEDDKDDFIMPFEVFNGAIIIDDPLKPEDSRSEIKRKSVNERYNNTIRSRVNDKNTPVIVIMQRLHEDDLSGFLLGGGSGEKWDHVCLPAMDDNNNPLCEDKHTFDDLMTIKNASPKTFSGQYMQRPSPDEGNIFKRDWFQIINETELKSIKWELYIDGAWTKNTNNDPTGYMIAGRHDNDLIIAYYDSNYKELPEAIDYAIRIKETVRNYSLVLSEPKASGLGFKQLLRKRGINATDITGDFIKVSKEERAETSSDYVHGGRVKLIKGNWNEAFLHEVCFFPNAKHDEAIDLLAYAIERNLKNTKTAAFIWGG